MGILGPEIIKAKSWGFTLRSQEAITSIKTSKVRGIAKEVTGKECGTNSKIDRHITRCLR